MKNWRIILACAASMMLVAGGATADFVNGDFENGAAGWSTNVPANWTIDFPATGGNPDGNAQIMSPFGDSGGEGSISQTFDCGAESEETCVITLDFRLEMIDAAPATGRVRIVLDGQEVFVSAPSNFIDWTAVAVYPSCGTHTLTASLQVDAGNAGWLANFDNFTATCSPVATETRSWSTIKKLYR